MIKNIQKLLAFYAIIGPILLTVLIIVLGFFQLGYNHILQYISELGAVGAPNAIVMNVFGFILVGSSIFVFGFVLFFNIS